MLGYTRGKRINQQLDYLEKMGVEEIFSDGPQDYGVFFEQESEYFKMMDFAQQGDKLVIYSLEVLSRDYQKLKQIFEEISSMGLSLIVLNQPILSVSEWSQIFDWSYRNEQILHPRVKKLNAEKDRDRNGYSPFSKESESRKIWWEVMWNILEKKKIREIANIKGLPIETVYRIKQEFNKIKQAIFISVSFILAIIMIKVAENFSENILIQFIVCIITTLVILYNTLIDSD